MGLVMRTYYAYVPAKPGFSAGSATNLLALYLSILYVYATILSRYEEVSRVDTDRMGENGSGFVYGRFLMHIGQFYHGVERLLALILMEWNSFF